VTVLDADARQLLREGHRRWVAPTSSDAAQNRVRLAELLSTRFDKQQSVIACKERRTAVLGTRRAGKTELVPSVILATAEDYPGTVIYYVGITGKRARELMWGALTRVVDTYALSWTPNKTLGTLSRRDGSEIRLVGADNLSELEKRRGDKASLVVVDEAQSYPDAVLHALLEDIFGPALVDVRGRFLLLGTPGIICGGTWHDITRNEDDDSRTRRDPRWTVFEVSALDNPHVAGNVRLEVAERDAAYGAEDPTTNREYRGRWVNDSSALFYAFDERRNTYDGKLPEGHSWNHVVGVDLGHDDAFAYVVWAFSSSCPGLYEVASFKKPGLTPAQWAQRLREVVEAYTPARVVVDTGGLGKAIVEEWQTREALPVDAAEKSNKAAYVQLLNSDLRLGRVKALRDGPLAQEWSRLPKDPDSPPGKPPSEDPRFPNHSADAGLYGWREALHWAGRTPDSVPDANSPEGQARAAEERKEAHRQRLQRRNREAQEWDE
jgi:hypothetical protein